ncbi:MAG: type II secretion system protein [Candidatus Eremiobacteraeota bacterium]|nr:type II secretion system protein [Candidatus Eremiobacteraeota bacterium]MBC5827412.1 type II secretion system protein [Candidatus Eremiobacteraeota bacterium]
MSKTKHARAFTLVEMVVAAGLVAMFLGLVYGMFLPVLGIASATSAKAESESPAATAFYQMQADLRVSATSGISTNLFPIPGALGSTAESTVLSIETAERFANSNDDHGQYYYFPDSGTPSWQSYVIWALVGPAADGTYSMYRTTYVPATAPGKTPLAAATLQAIVNNISSTGTRVMHGVSSFQVAAITQSPVIFNQCLPPDCPTFPRAEIQVEFANQSVDQKGQVSLTAFQTQVFTRNN